MGVRTVVARLWLRLAAASARWDKKPQVSSFSQFISRRSSTLAADVPGKKWELSKSKSELNKEKTLYLCFSEKSRCDYIWWIPYWSNSPHASNWTNYYQLQAPMLIDDDSFELREAAYKRMKLQLYHTNCSRFGSQILFAGGIRQKSLNDRGYPIPNRDIWGFLAPQGKPK